jgi:hypothetical protein
LLLAVVRVGGALESPSGVFGARRGFYFCFFMFWVLREVTTARLFSIAEPSRVEEEWRHGEGGEDEPGLGDGGVGASRVKADHVSSALVGGGGLPNGAQWINWM